SIYYRVAKKLNQQTKPILDKAEQDYLDLGIDPDKMIMELDLDPEIFTYNNEPLAVDEEAMEEATVKEEIVEETPEGIIKDTTSGAIRRIKRKFSFLSTRVTRSRTVVEQHHHDDDQDNYTGSKSNLQTGDKPRKIRKLPKGWVMLPDDDEEEVEKVEKEEELDETLMDVDQKQEELVDDDVVSSRTRSRKTTRIEELDTVEPLKNETDIIHGKRTIRDMIVDTSPTVASTPTYSRRTNRDPIIDTSPTISPTSTYSRRTNRDIMTDTSPTPIYGRRTNRDIIADISPAPIYGRRTNHNVTDTSPTVSPTARYGRRTNRYVTDMSPIVSPTARYGRRTNLDTSPTVSPATRFGRRTNLDMSPTVSPATRYSKRINRDVIDTSPIVSPAATISTIVSSTTASPLSRKKLNTAVLESTDISYGSLVWAKMQGFPWYPAEIVHPGSLQVPEAVRHDKKDGDMFLVRFFDEKPGKKNGSRSCRRTNRDPIIDTSPTISPTSTYSRRTNRDIMTDTSPTPIYGRRTNRDIIADISPAPIYGRRTNHNVTDTSPTVSPTARYGRRTNRYVTDMSPIVSPTARYGRRTNLDTSPTVSPATRFGRRTNLDMSPTVSPATRYSKRINRDVIDTSPIVSPAATISTIVSSTTASPLSRKKLNTAVLESTDISYGSLVWAKMQGFPWYPAEIVHPGSLQVPEAVRHDKKDGDMFLVRFFDEKPGKKNGSRSW
ncbi:16674_t:CDS:2, partial [Entrophospora sp. SA101]